jgi:hypothetical protein
LEVTAQDLGAPGKDAESGNGLVQAAAAYQYLLQFPEPCGLIPASVAPVSAVNGSTVENTQNSDTLIRRDRPDEPSTPKDDYKVTGDFGSEGPVERGNRTGRQLRQRIPKG